MICWYKDNIKTYDTYVQPFPEQITWARDWHGLKTQVSKILLGLSRLMGWLPWILLWSYSSYSTCVAKCHDLDVGWVYSFWGFQHGRAQGDPPNLRILRDQILITFSLDHIMHFPPVVPFGGPGDISSYHQTGPSAVDHSWAAEGKLDAKTSGNDRADAGI